MKILILFLCTLLSTLHVSGQTKDSTFLYKIMPQNIKIQHAGNIGMFSVGFGYQSPNKKWKGDFMYGIVPPKYADKAIHSITLKGKFAPINTTYTPDLSVNWLNTGLWVSRALGSKYFRGLPDYYDDGYYYFSTAMHIGVFVGSEVKYKKLGFYYEVGTTEKHIINYVKNTGSIQLNAIFNIGMGLVYHLK